MNQSPLYRWVKASERLPVLVNANTQICYRNDFGTIGVFFAGLGRKLEAGPSFYEWLEKIPTTETEHGETAEEIYSRFFGPNMKWNPPPGAKKELIKAIEYASQFKKEVPVSEANESDSMMNNHPGTGYM